MALNTAPRLAHVTGRAGSKPSDLLSPPGAEVLTRQADPTKAGPLGFLQAGRDPRAKPVTHTERGAPAPPSKAAFAQRAAPSGLSSDHILFVLGLLSAQSAQFHPSPPGPQWNPRVRNAQQSGALRARAPGVGWGAYIKQGAPRSCTSQTGTQSSSAQPGPGPAAQAGADPQHREYGRSIPSRNRTQASLQVGSWALGARNPGDPQAGKAPRVETHTSSCRLEQAEIDHRCPPGLGPGPPSVFSCQVLDVRA